MQYIVQNVTGSDCQFSQQDISIDELCHLLNSGLFNSNCTVVYEDSDEMQLKRKLFYYESTYPYGYEYLDRASKNTYLITRVDVEGNVTVRSVIKLLNDYINVRPKFLANRLSVCELPELQDCIVLGCSIVDNLIELILNNIIRLDIKNVSLDSSVVYVPTGKKYNLYLFIDLVKQIYYAI